VENRIRPVALGRNKLRAGKRAAAIMSLIQSARLNGDDAFAYLKDVIKRLPTQPASRIGELLPYRRPSASDRVRCALRIGVAYRNSTTAANMSSADFNARHWNGRASRSQ
jgi:hypothetical protein